MKRTAKLTVSIDIDPESHTIIAQLLADSSVHDATPVQPLLEQVEQEIETFYDDGAYDTWAAREHLEEERIHLIIPRFDPIRHGRRLRKGGSARPSEMGFGTGTR